MGKSWHSDHFVCCVAGCKFEDGKFFAKVSDSVCRGRMLLYGCVCMCVCVRARAFVCVYVCVNTTMCTQVTAYALEPQDDDSGKGTRPYCERHYLDVFVPKVTPFLRTFILCSYVFVCLNTFVCDDVMFCFLCCGEPIPWLCILFSPCTFLIADTHADTHTHMFSRAHTHTFAFRVIELYFRCVVTCGNCICCVSLPSITLTFRVAVPWLFEPCRGSWRRCLRLQLAR